MMRSPSFGLRPVVSVSRTTCRIPRDPLVGEPVRPLVLDMAGVAFYPVPFYVVHGGKLVELLPEIDVLHRLLVGGAPAATLPLPDPLRDAFLHVLGVGVQAHAAGALERLQRADHRGELHAVVGGVRFPAPQLLLRAARAQQHAPAARTGVAPAGAVAVDLHHIVSHGSCASAAGSARAGGGAPARAAMPA